MDAKELYEKLEGEVEKGNLDKDSSGGETELQYFGTDNNGNRIKAYVKRYDIEYKKDGNTLYTAYVCFDVKGVIEDYIVEDKRNNITYSQFFTNTLNPSKKND